MTNISVSTIRAQARHINRVWKLAIDADTLGAWAEIYRVIESYNRPGPGMTENHLELLDFLQSIAFIRYAMLERELNK